MQISIAVPRTVADARILLATIDFRQISAGELQGFAGADEGDLIGEFGDFGICVYGESTVQFFDCDDEFVDQSIFALDEDGVIYQMI